MTMNKIERIKEFGGWLERWQHASTSCHCPMTFSVYLPPQAATQKLPVVYWLSGLTCTDDNVRVKAGAQRYCAELGLILVMPDTSPRGDDVPDVPERYDLGQGAGFYVNATQPPWATHYQMYDYVTRELPALVEANFPVVPGVASISGHSMGGHGALICALKNPGQYRSVSAFSPICNPVVSPLGTRLFRRVSRQRQSGVGSLGRDLPRQCRRDATARPDRSRHGGRVSGRTALSAASASRLRRTSSAVDAADAGRLRPQLPLHRQLHRRTSGVSRPRAVDPLIGSVCFFPFLLQGKRMSPTRPDLFDPLQLGPLLLPNRIVMAPLTRNRASAGNVPGPMNIEYYVQRASAGLIITEATYISPQGIGYPMTPGIHNDAQVAGWRNVVDAVHAAGGRIFLQLWHVGRISHPSLQPEGDAAGCAERTPAGGRSGHLSGHAALRHPARTGNAGNPRHRRRLPACR